MKNYLIIITAFLFSCTSAPKHLAKAIKKDKPYVAAETRKLFPCIETKNGKPDSTAYKQYLQELQELQDFYNSQEPPQARVDSFETVWTDSTKIVELKKDLANQKILYSRLAKKCNDNPPIHDTTYIEDSAKIFSLNKEMGRMDTAIGAQESEIKDLTKARNKWRKWCLITWFVLGLGIAGKIIFKNYKLL